MSVYGAEMNAEECGTGIPTPLVYALPWQDFYLSQ